MFSIFSSGLLIVILEMAADIFLNLLFGFVNPKVPLTEDIRFQFQEDLHGFSPGNQVGTERVRKRTMDILPEKDSLPLAVQDHRYRPRRVARRMQAQEFSLAEFQNLPNLAQRV